MELWRQLRLRPGLICLTGSGGKTTLAHLLAASLPGRVIFCTTTKIYPSPTLPLFSCGGEDALDRLLAEHRAVCVGVPAAEGKLSAPLLSFRQLRRLADFILVEADGSKGLPLKAHLPYVPVLPKGFDRNLLLVGASGFDRPISRAAHRPERFAQLAGCGTDDPASPEVVAAVLNAEGGFDTVIVNQASGPALMDRAGRLNKQLNVPLFAGELRQGALTRLSLFDGH